MIALGFCLVTFGASYAEVRAAAQQLDQLGFDSVWVWDHYVSWDDPREPVLECWTTLAALAEATQRIRLGPLVANNTNRHPGRLAKVAATLHEIAGQRSELGIGAGGLEFEQAAFGIEQGSPGERVAALSEALRIIPALWQGEPVTFHGEHYHLEHAISAPGLTPRPRIIVGASGPRMARLAGRSAEGLNLAWRHRDRFPELLAALDDGLAERGRDRAGFDLSVHPSWHDLMADPPAMLAAWEQAGFDRAIVYVRAPFPLQVFAALAHQVGLT
jgi:alkanesulfonate monooxygenase SsuD/methylene tetrahydromethanopterin reductase-like flavin-dependent oxidoreductase (luciferase family)